MPADIRHKLQAHPDPTRSRILADSKRMPNGCREWQGSRNRDGYGRITVAGRSRGTHAVAYESVRGPVPEGLVLDHLICDNPSCCDEWHLEPVTQRDNSLRGNGATAVNARKTHCIHGHPLSGDNVRMGTRDGFPTRTCRSCEREHHRRYRAMRDPWQLPTHCPHGHEFNEKNTYRDKHGFRHCRTCCAASKRRRMAAKRDAKARP